MGAYLVRRVLLIFPTLFGIMLINFAIIQIVPGGPVEQMIAQMTGTAVESTARFSGGGEGELNSSFDASSFDDGDSKYRGAQGLDPDIIKEIEVMYGMNKPAHERFFKMLKSYIFFDFGESFFRDQKVTSLVLDKMPVSISLGLWTTLLVYLISIPLGIRKAIKDGSRFDIISSSIVTIGYAIPNFLFAVILIVFFAGGRFYDIFPLRGLVSENFEELTLLAQIKDYFWHLTLPLLAMIVSGFAGLTFLTKNSFIDQINQQYVMTAKAKGLSERKVLYGHVFRNAMLIVIAGFPSAFIGILFSSSLFIEVIFSLDGLGLLGYEAALTRDYPVIFATLYFFSLLGLVMGIFGDFMYSLIDPRIDFESRE
ncbi:microcin C ABC transporter permease YejB [Alphaproteobacteria bacterium]|nr:microcin C ABC transporter permease YejB [Alphaproteobacteria bacterium]